jgi:hypothetical protein
VDRGTSVRSGSTTSTRKNAGGLARQRGNHGVWSDEEDVGKSARKKAKYSSRVG